VKRELESCCARAVRARNSVRLGLDLGSGSTAISDATHDPPARATRAHRVIHDGAIDTLTKPLIGASNWLVGYKTRPPPSLATARIAAILIISLTLVTQPHLYSTTHHTRRVFPARHDTSREPDGLDYHHTPTRRGPSSGSGARQCAASN